MPEDTQAGLRLLSGSSSRTNRNKDIPGTGSDAQTKPKNHNTETINGKHELEDLIRTDTETDHLENTKNHFNDGFSSNRTTTIEEDEDTEPKRCLGLRRFCQNFTAPLLVESHPLLPSPSKLDHLKRAFFCPPFGRVGAFLLVVVMFFMWWGVLISMTKEEALPGGTVFSMFVFFLACWCAGYLIQLIHLPSLFGMLLTGIVLGNVLGIDVGRHIDPTWSSTCRNVALTVILLKAGLGLDPVALHQLSFVVLRLAFCPSLVEAAVDSVAAHLILGFSWPWATLLAFVMAVVSPAVIVPSMLSLSDRGCGLNKGIPTLVIAAVSMDAVLAITGFDVTLGIVFSSTNIVLSILKGPLEVLVGILGGSGMGVILWYSSEIQPNIVLSILKGPLEVLVGILGGSGMGVILWYIPQKSSPDQLLFRSTLLLGAELVSIFGSKYIGWAGCGPLACLGVAFVTALRWRHEYPKGKKTPVEEAIGVLWLVFQPLLFGLIGAKVDFSKLQPHTVGLGAAVLFSGLVFRLGVAYLTMLGSALSTRERIFIPFSWLPKATVQAAIGGIALDTATELDAGPEAIELGGKVLTIAVLAILITAPIGALAIALLGPRLLHHTEPGQTVEDLENRAEKLQDLAESPA